MPITKADVEKMAANAVLWDQGRACVAGFGVRRQRKFAVFVLKYSFLGRQRWLTIGRYGHPWSVDQARIEAKRLHGLIASGEDPASTRSLRDNATTLTVARLCDMYLDAASAGAVITRFNRPKKRSTLLIDQGRIDRHIKPLLGATSVSDVDSRAIGKLIADITRGKTAADVVTGPRGRARVRGGASTAARVADLMSGILAWAIEQGYLSTNPVHGVRRVRSEPKQRFLTDTELGKLGAILSHGLDLDRDRRFHPYAVKIITLLCLTGCRSSEIAGLSQSEVDSDHSCLRLHDTKAGFSIRAIGSIARDILLAQPILTGSRFVFPGAKGTASYQGLNKEAPRVFRAAGLAGVTPHVLRHTFASIASELGYSDGTIAGLLGHKGRGVTARYIHRPDNALASAAEAVSVAVHERLYLPA